MVLDNNFQSLHTWSYAHMCTHTHRCSHPCKHVCGHIHVHESGKRKSNNKKECEPKSLIWGCFAISLDVSEAHSFMTQQYRPHARQQRTFFCLRPPSKRSPCALLCFESEMAPTRLCFESMTSRWWHSSGGSGAVC